MYRRGLFPLSADPITYGHLNIIARAARECDELIVMISSSDTKKPTFTLAERAAMTKRAVEHDLLTNVRVLWSADIVGSLYLELGCDALFRGVRSDKDRRDEEELLGAYYALWPFMHGHIVLLEAHEDLRHVSSTVARIWAARCLPLESIVPLHVKQALEERVVGQYKIGITGGIATGKSWLSTSLADAAAARGIAVHSIQIDEMIRRAYDATTMGGETLRAAISAVLGPAAINGKTVDRRYIAERIFDPAFGEQRRADYLALTMPYVKLEYQRALHDRSGTPRSGLIIVEWSQFAEMHMNAWVNNNIVVVSADPRDHTAFIEKRGITAARLANNQALQWPASKVTRELQNRVIEAGSGRVWEFRNALQPILVSHFFDTAILPHFPSLK